MLIFYYKILSKNEKELDMCVSVQGGLFYEISVLPNYQ